MSDEFLDALEGESEAVENWNPEVGDVLVGVLLRVERRSSEFGEYEVAIVMGEVTKKPMAAWLSTTVVKAEFLAESPLVGERIGFKRLPDGVNRNGKPYKVILVRVDRTKSSRAGPETKADAGLPTL